MARTYNLTLDILVGALFEIAEKYKMGGATERTVGHALEDLARRVEKDVLRDEAV